VLQDFHTMAFDSTAAGFTGTSLTAPATVDHRLWEYGDMGSGMAGCQAGI
jgi:hypothetical protein